MRSTPRILGLVISLLFSGLAPADPNERSAREQAAEKYISTFCVTDRGFGVTGGAIRSDGATHFSPIVRMNGTQIIRREYAVSPDEMRIVWRDAYAEILTIEEFSVLTNFCRPENESLRNALNKQRKKDAAQRFVATMKREISKNPSLAPFESSVSNADKGREFDLSPLEIKALAEVNDSLVAQRAIKSIDERLSKLVHVKLWEIAKVRGIDSPDR